MTAELPHVAERVPAYDSDGNRKGSVAVERANYGPDAHGPAAYLDVPKDGNWLDAKGTRVLFETLAKILGVDVSGSTPGPVIYGEGTALIVTGDTRDYDHGLQPGQAVTVRRYDDSDDTYLVRATGGDEDAYGNWISSDDVTPALDLTPEPEPTPSSFAARARRATVTHSTEPVTVTAPKPLAEALRDAVAGGLLAPATPPLFRKGERVRYIGGGAMSALPGATAVLTEDFVPRPGGSPYLRLRWERENRRRMGQRDGGYSAAYFVRDAGAPTRPIRGGDTVTVLYDGPSGADLRKGDRVVVRSTRDEGMGLRVTAARDGARIGRRTPPVGGWYVRASDVTLTGE